MDCNHHRRRLHSYSRYSYDYFLLFQHLVLLCMIMLAICMPTHSIGILCFSRTLSFLLIDCTGVTIQVHTCATENTLLLRIVKYSSVDRSVTTSCFSSLRLCFNIFNDLFCCEKFLNKATKILHIYQVFVMRFFYKLLVLDMSCFLFY